MDTPLLDLRALLMEGQRASDAVLRRIDAGADLVEVVTLLESLAILDERRAQELDRLRREASTQRRREEERSIRQFILRALEQIGVPQTTGFLEDYLWATELVEAKSRGLGSLRRDEYRAWTRRGDRPRVAYIVPCLDPAGLPLPRWLSRSDWPLPARIAVEGAEELWSLRRVRALIAAYRETSPETRSRFVPMLAAWGQPSSEGGELEVIRSENYDLEFESLSPLLADLEPRLAALEPKVRTRQEAAARRLEGSAEQLLWGLRS